MLLLQGKWKNLFIEKCILQPVATTRQMAKYILQPEFQGDLTTRCEFIKILLMERFKSTRVIVTSRSWKADLIRQTPSLSKAYAFISVEGITIRGTRTHALHPLLIGEY